jgi:hypothetical protein
MKRFALSAAALLGLMAAASTAPAQTLTWLNHIDVGGFEVTPTSIATDTAGNAYVAGFSQRRLLKITGVVTGSPSVSVLATTHSGDTPAGPVTWIPDTGLSSVDFQAPNKVLVAGDTFDATNGGAAIIFDADTGAQIAAAIAPLPEPPLPGTAGRRIAGAIFYGTNNVLAQFQAGTNYWWLPSTLDTVSFYSGPTPSASRGMARAADGTVYISHNNAFVGDGTVAGIHRIIDGAPADDIAGNTNESNWFTTTRTDTSGGAIQGIAVSTYNSTEYVLLSKREDSQVLMLATTGPGVPPGSPITLTHPEMERPASARILTVGGSQFLLVTQYGRPSAPNSTVSVFGIDGATLLNVSDWTSY